MKKLIFPIVCCFISVTVSAQLIKPKAETQKKQSELDWFNCSFDQDSVYGAEVNKAYDYLKANKKKAKKRPVVALIGLELAGSAASTAGLLDDKIDKKIVIVFLVSL